LPVAIIGFPIPGPNTILRNDTTIFNTSLDDADREHTGLPGGDFVPPPDQERARKMADYAVRIMRSKGDHLAMMRKHIASLDLTLPRLVRLNRFARGNAMTDRYGKSGDAPKQQGVTWGQWRVASLLVHRAALPLTTIARPNSPRSQCLSAGAFSLQQRALGRCQQRDRRRLSAMSRHALTRLESCRAESKRDSHVCLRAFGSRV
jgi:hypothetical protein